MSQLRKRPPPDGTLVVIKGVRGKLCRLKPAEKRKRIYYLEGQENVKESWVTLRYVEPFNHIAGQENDKQSDTESEDVPEECLGCETGCDADGPHRLSNGKYHPNCYIHYSG